jgi:hypothetical protein
LVGASPSEWRLVDNAEGGGDPVDRSPGPGVLGLNRKTTVPS